MRRDAKGEWRSSRSGRHENASVQKGNSVQPFHFPTQAKTRLECATRPYGGEIPINGDPNTYKFTGKERDTESGLDNFGKRYDASNLGRFMTPDSFYKDAHVSDPQSWNEYVYARDNPLRYVDPTGEAADVSATCTTDAHGATTCNVSITANIAIYAMPGSGITPGQLSNAASTIQSSIQNAFSGSFTTQNGVTYNVTAQVSVSVANSQDAAMQSGAKNVIGLSNGPASATADSIVNPRVLSPTAGIRGIDTGVWNINSLGNDIAAHEFTHLLGVGDRGKGELVLSNTDFLNNSQIPHTATDRDFNWGIREAVRAVNLHLGSIQEQSLGWPVQNPFTRRETVGAPWLWWK
jgi:RHS repeat-associated protein